MNKQMLLDWLISEADLKADQYYEEIQKIYHENLWSIEPLLCELNGRKELELPKRIPVNPDEAPQVFTEENPQYHHRVDLISLFLHHYYPNKYLFFRPSTLDREIFTGLEDFSDIRNEFAFPFSHVSRYGLKEYLEFNRVMFKFAVDCWPLSNLKIFMKGKLQIKPEFFEKIQNRFSYFLYQGMANLFLEKNEYNRYWLIATKKDYFDSLDADDQTSWSGRKEMQKGDIVLAYRMKPRSAITDIFTVSRVPDFDPYGAWDGFWVDIRRVCKIPDITFAMMHGDEVMKECAFVRKSFQGSVTESVPYHFYNRLLDYIPQGIKDKHGLTAEEVAITGSSGDFSSEAEFEDQIISPLLKRWGFKFRQQNPCFFHVGGQIHHTRIDFLVSDARGPITLFEDKFQIIGEKLLALARDQAKSYALMLGLPSFVVAAPEGMWVYSLKKNTASLVANLTSGELARKDADIRSLLLKLR